MTTSSGKTFLIGATGDIGGQTLKLLQDAAAPVRVMCRRQTQVDDFKEQGVDAIRGSLDDSVEDLASYMHGCDRLYLNTAATPSQRQQNINAIDAAISAGLKWIIKISAADARDDTNVPWVTAHAAADRYLKQEAEKHKVSWTLLSASAFMQNILTEAPAIKKGFLPQTSGDGKAGWIDSADIAAVSMQVLIDGPEKHHQQKYILTGPALISMPDIAAALTRQVGHTVRYLHVPGPIFGFVLRLSGLDAWNANGLVAQFVDILRPNKEGIDVIDAVEKITGKPPTSIDQFAARNRAAFGGFDVLPYVGVVTAAVAVSAAVAVRTYMK